MAAVQKERSRVQELMMLTGLSMAVFVTPPIGPSQPQQSAMHSLNFHRQAGRHTTTTFGSYEMMKMMTTRAIFMNLLKALTSLDHIHSAVVQNRFFFLSFFMSHYMCKAFNMQH